MSNDNGIPRGMTVAEAGKRGGDKVKAKYGPEFYKEIGKKGGNATSKRHGREFYEAIGKMGGRLGGDATKARFGTEHYQEIGKQGGAKVKALIEAGKAAAAADRAKA